MGKTIMQDLVFLKQITAWLDQQGYDVIKREPEIAPCPVCEDGAMVCEASDGEYVMCLGKRCPIRTFEYLTPGKALEIWNALPRKAGRE